MEVEAMTIELAMGELVTMEAETAGPKLVAEERAGPMLVVEERGVTARLKIAAAVGGGRR